MRLSWSRWVGIMLKEFIQLKRDRLTFGMIIGIPIIQLVLFGYAINSDPKRLPTAVLAADRGIYERSVLWALRNSGYFRIEREARNEAEAEALIAAGTVQFVVTVPENFSRKLARGERPVLLVEADATDPSATVNAIAALADKGITVLVSTHYMDEASRCDQLAYIAYGKLLAVGTAAELISSTGEKDLEAVFINLMKGVEDNFQ